MPTSLLLHFDGANNSTTFTDSGPFGLSITAGGNAKLSTVQRKIGTASALFDGDGDSLQLPSSTELDFGTGPFTIDFFMRTNGSQDDFSSIVSRFSNAPSTGGTTTFSILNNSGYVSPTFSVVLAGTTYISLLASSLPVNNNDWHHVAISRDGVNLYLGVDGAIVASNSSVGVADSVTISSGRIGRSQTNNLTDNNYNGYLDEFRVTKGEALYTTTYIVPYSNYIYDITTGFKTTDTNTNYTQDLGSRYITKNYLLDVYPNIASSTGNRTAPGLWGWGDNRRYQLGLGNLGYYSSPVQIGALTNWKQISTSTLTSFAIKTDGTMWSWGLNGVSENISGFLGQNIGAPTIYYSSPVQIGALTTWKSVVGGYTKCHAIRSDGTLWGWGLNSLGELGVGNRVVYYSSPVQIGALTTWKQIGINACNSSADFSLALRNDGALFAWGDNRYGELGINTLGTLYYSSPIQVGALTNWKQVAGGGGGAAGPGGVGGNGTAANASGGKGGGGGGASLTTAGSNAGAAGVNGATGGNGGGGTGGGAGGISPNGSGTAGTAGTGGGGGGAVGSGIGGGGGTGSYWTQTSNSATAGSGGGGGGGDGVGGLYGGGGSGSAAAGAQGIIVFTYDGTVIGQKSGYAFPILNSDGTASNTIVDFDDMFVQKELFLNAGLYAWGNNGAGALGTFGTTSYSSPIQVGALTNWKQITVGNSSTLATKVDGTLWAWGGNDSGQLGLNNRTDYLSPVQVGSLYNWKQVSHYYQFTHAIKTDGTLWSWGYNNYGQLGNNTVNVYYSSPIQVGSLTNWKQVVAGAYGGFAVKTDGTLWGWGWNVYGELGNGGTTPYSSPIQIGTLTTWKYVSAGDRNFLAIKTDGTLWGCGNNGVGVLGINNVTSPQTPVQVGTSTNWKQVNITNCIAAGIKTDGTLWTWGQNIYGELGIGSRGNYYSSPVQVGSLTNWKQVTTFSGNFGASSNFCVALKTDGTLWTWGGNSAGQLGQGYATSTYYSSPIQVGALTTWKVVQVTTGNQAVLAISSPDLP